MHTVDLSCDPTLQMSQEEWQAKRREAYVRRTGQTSATGYGDAGPSVKGVPCGIGTLNQNDQALRSLVGTGDPRWAPAKKTRVIHPLFFGGSQLILMGRSYLQLFKAGRWVNSEIDYDIYDRLC